MFFFGWRVHDFGFFCFNHNCVHVSSSSGAFQDRWGAGLWDVCSKRSEVVGEWGMCAFLSHEMFEYELFDPLKTEPVQYETGSRATLSVG